MKVASSDCFYNKAKKELQFAINGGFPDRFVVVSSRTGDEVVFFPVHYDHPLFNEDYNDGEFAYYVPDIDCGINRVVLYPLNSQFYLGV